jgi:solute carrier family 1 (high affinity glutamate transporter) protein 3
MGQIEGIVLGLIPGNIVDSAAKDNLMGVIFFSMILGLAISRQEQDSVFLRFFKELGEIMMTIVQVLVLLTPIGVFSLIVPKVATIDLVTIGKYLGLMLAILIAGLLIHTFITLPTLFFTLTRRNPFHYMKNLLPMVLTAFATSSSAATLPTTTKCAVEANKVDPRIASFVLPLGATINMDGTAVKYPIMVIWIAYAQGMTFSASNQVLLALLAVLSSIGSAPIPTAGLAMWIMVLNATGVPINGLLGLLYGLEWLVDRCETMVNVTSDSICAGIMNYIIDLDQIDVEKGEASPSANEVRKLHHGPTGRTISSGSRNGRVHTEAAPLDSEQST